MPLSSKQKRILRQHAHHMRPVVIIGQHGLSENVMLEIEQAIDHHELVKLRVNAEDRQQRLQFIEQIGQHTQSELVLQIGHIAVFFRRNTKNPRYTLGKS